MKKTPTLGASPTNKSWFGDTDQQCEQQVKQRDTIKQYASAKSLCDLDGKQSIKTMHERHDEVAISDDEHDDKTKDDGRTVTE